MFEFENIDKEYIKNHIDNIDDRYKLNKEGVLLFRLTIRIYIYIVILKILSCIIFIDLLIDIFSEGIDWLVIGCFWIIFIIFDKEEKKRKVNKSKILKIGDIIEDD